MPIENHLSTGDVSSPGLDSQHLAIACGGSGAGHHRNAGPGLFDLLFRTRHGWLPKSSLAAPPTRRRCTRCTHDKVSSRIPATLQAFNKRPRSFQSSAHPKAVIP